MKKISLAVLCLLAVACNKVKENTYEVTVAIDGIEDGKLAYLQKPQENAAPVTVDTLEIKDGKFTFSGESMTPEIHYILVDGVRGAMPIVLEEGKINVTAYKDSIGLSKIEGTPSNNDYTSFIQGSRKIANKMNALRNELMSASQGGDTAIVATLQESYQSVQKQANQYEKDFVKSNPNSYMSLLIFEQLFYSNGLTEEEIPALFNTLSEEVKALERAKKVKTNIDAMLSTSIGGTAPDFSAPTPEGATLSLAQAKGKVTIVEFWAAWCKPCRIENPNLVATYNKYHEKGLNIIAVSLDRNGEDWKKAIADDKLTWNHVSNLMFWQDPVAKLYNVRAIPASFILDENGKIVARDLRGEELDSKIGELLNP